MIRNSSYKNSVALLVNTCGAVSAVFVALYLRIGMNLFNYRHDYLLEILIFVAGSFIISDCVFKVYRDIWRFFSLDYLIKIARYATFAIILFLVSLYFAPSLEKFPRSVLIMSWLLSILFISTPRLLYRAYFDGTFNLALKRTKSTATKVLIIGLDRTIERFIREIRAQEDPVYEFTGILESSENIGRVIEGIPILGSIEHLEPVVKKMIAKGQQPSRILVSSEMNLKGRLNDLIKKCEELSIPLSRLPKQTSLNHNIGAALPLHPIAIEDLLRRSQKNLNLSQIRALTTGKVVLITGAGGSIGSEIVRQVAESNPKFLLLLDNSEFLLYEIEQECKMKFPNIQARSLLSDIKDFQELELIFTKYKPEVVFHAAALKHVPMLENHRVNAVRTNIFGTKNLVSLASSHQCQKFVLISTDKAVDPLSFMGSTKRLAEACCHVIGGNEMQINIVRFGNVLGSNGSVVPLFQKQIADGGPVTVTAPDATRFFMTIKEAVGLVLQAASLNSAERTNVYVLDMGEPVRIDDLARQMIKLAGLRPDEDIKIKYIGLRPGEKLHEILVTEHESLSSTENVDIMKAKPIFASYHKVTELFTQLESACQFKDEELCYKLIFEFISNELKPNKTN